MDKNQYQQARRLFRSSGRHEALPLMDESIRTPFKRILAEQDCRDWLEERAAMIDYCKANNIKCTPRHTERRPEKQYRVNRLLDS